MLYNRTRHVLYNKCNTPKCLNINAKTTTRVICNDISIKKHVLYTFWFMSLIRVFWCTARSIVS